MCSLLLAWQVIDDAPVVLAANRDEAYDRPATGPRLLTADPRVIAPVDQEAGGTWIGANEHGLVVALANRRDGPAGERSRGQLVRDLLGTDSSDEARTFLASLLGERQYAGFHLLLLDPNQAFYVTWFGQHEGHELAPGVHVLDNTGLDEAAEIPREVRGDLEVDPGEPHETWLERATDLLGDHAYDLCHHGDDHGTVSASTVTIVTGADPRVAFTHAPGPPCETAFESSAEL